MRVGKVILSVVLVFILCLSVMLPAGANTDLTTWEKANVLNQLTILKGDGGDYKLDDKLKRSEAAAFIVRVMGMEDHVLRCSSYYDTTDFPDVKSTDWFAAYVGFCAKDNIINGYSNGNFGPNDSISEKAFLKLALGALGYEYGTDFTWGEVYSKAYDVGIVGVGYSERTADNLNYTRRDVVTVLYNLLTKNKSGTTDTMIQNLVDNGVITHQTAVSCGLIQDNVEIDIIQLAVLNQNSIFIQFSENMGDITEENIKIYETNDFTNILDVEVQAQQPTTLVLNTSDQLAYEDYTVEITGVKDADGNPTEVISGTFTGYQASQITSDFFRVSRVQPVSKSVVNVYFTHPVNTNSEIASYYEILEGDEIFASGTLQTLEAGLNGSGNNVVSIYLRGKTFTKDSSYTLKVSGDLTSIYGVKLNEGEGDVMRFKGVDTDDEGMKVTSVSLLDYKTLQLEFNKEVHPTRAQQVFSYYITQLDGTYPVAVSSAVVTGAGVKKDRIVHISIAGAFDKTKNYKIMINEINDISRQYSIIEKEYTFSGQYSNGTATLGISSTRALDRGTITVRFNRALDAATATNTNYYFINGVTHTGFSTIPAKIYFDNENSPDTVKLYMPIDKNLLGNKSYKVTVIGAMKDYLGTVSGVTLESAFTGSSNNNVAPVISDAVIISSDTIKLTFSKEIALEQPNILSSNYTLQYEDGGRVITKVPLIAGYINSTTIVLKFDVLDFEKEYTLSFGSLKDYSGLYTRTAQDGSNSVKVRLGNR